MKVVLITGANGEIGHGLIPALSKMGVYIISLDINELDESLRKYVQEVIVANILDKEVMQTLIRKHRIDTIFHLAAILSTSGEKNPKIAHEVNVNGTQTLLEISNNISQSEERTIKFIFPSTIAVYGIPDGNLRQKLPPIKESEFNTPITMYGANKLYCELLGKYYSKNYKLLDEKPKRFLDFRCIRFPGIISAMTLPSGGTSDYAPEMIHKAVKGEVYNCFVSEDTKIPFMVMPDAIKALIQISKVERKSLTQDVYNVASFSVTALEISELIKKVFPNAKINYTPDKNRQKIVDSWPKELDDSKARNDWGWKPDYDFQKAFSEYLIPEIQNRYKQK